MEYRLLEKTEIWISPIKLSGVDLGACAGAAAHALDLSPGEITVTDVIDDRLTLDILVPTIDAEQIVARKTRLLRALQKVPGVVLSSETNVHSEGILGLIGLDERTGKELLERSRAMETQIEAYVRRRCIVFPTGKEVLGGQIRDTNTPFLLGVLQDEGYQVVKGPILQDREDAIARAMRLAAEEGYGLIITTGGIGAESKDQTLEALARVDPQASMPYILRFREGEGRHHRDGVRIGVGRLEKTLIVCLPGPHDEVRLAWPVLRDGLNGDWDEETLAEVLADVLRKKFLLRSGVHRESVQYEKGEDLYGAE